MKIGGDYTFDGPRELVWEMLLDPVVLTQVLPGAEKLDRTGENEYEGALKMKVGPIQGDFNGKVRLEDIDAPNGYTMKVDGRGAPGFVKATGHLRLSADGERTRVEYDGDAQVGGKLAAVGQRLIESSARAIIAQSLDGLNTVVKAKVASRAGGPAAAAKAVFEKPTQTEFAASVAKQVARELIPSGVRKLIIAIIVLLVLLLIYRIVT